MSTSLAPRSQADLRADRGADRRGNKFLELKYYERLYYIMWRLRALITFLVVGCSCSYLLYQLGTEG